MKILLFYDSEIRLQHWLTKCMDGNVKKIKITVGGSETALVSLGIVYSWVWINVLDCCYEGAAKAEGNGFDLPVSLYLTFKHFIS